MSELQPKPFWSKPEGKTGAIVLLLGGLGLGWLATTFFASILAFLMTTIGAFVGLMVLGTVVFMALDGQTRALVSYMYKSLMRWVTGLFIEINPIAILKGYIEDLRTNLKSMTKQIAKLRGQMHKLKEMLINNQRDIESNLDLAKQAKMSNNQTQIILKSRKAGRLQESNVKLDELYKKMEILYRVLTKMQENSTILVEDIEDQVKIKEQEYKAITAGNSAMKSAMRVIKGDKDKRAIFDEALEVIANDVSQKVGEMEQFMSLSENFMQSIDLQNGIFEEEGLKMLEKWEKDGVSILLGESKSTILKDVDNEKDILELEHPMAEPIKVEHKNQYDSLFD